MGSEINPQVEIAVLDQIIKQTLSALNRGRHEIDGIAGAARNEYLSVFQEFERLKNEVEDHIRGVDALEKADRAARSRLLEVSQALGKYTEADIKQAYEDAQEQQVKLGIYREKEKQLRRQRDSLERRLKALEAMAEKAENLVGRVSLAMDYLAGNLKDLSAQIKNLEERRDLGLQIIKAQEDERRRLAREIHDGPAQILANVVLRIDICQKLAQTDTERLLEELAQLKELIRASLQDVRKVIFDLRPMALDDLGLVPALRSFVSDFQDKAGIPAELVVFGTERRMTPAFEVAMFRLIQEALNNVHKHAFASEAKVKVEFTPEAVVLQIGDNGRGFDYPAVREAGRGVSFGLVGMRERVDLLHGKMEINTAVGKGTQIKFFIPIPSDDAPTKGGRPWKR